MPVYFLLSLLFTFFQCFFNYLYASTSYSSLALKMASFSLTASYPTNYINLHHYHNFYGPLITASIRRPLTTLHSLLLMVSPHGAHLGMHISVSLLRVILFVTLALTVDHPPTRQTLQAAFKCSPLDTTLRLVSVLYILVSTQDY